MSHQKHRLEFLDGLRGIAALVVVFYHFSCAFIPSIVPDQYQKPFLVADTPVNILYNGPFAVIIFFTLSGFVVASSAAVKTDNIAITLLTRYIRLSFPATMSIVFAWLLLQCFPSEMEKLSRLLPHPWLRFTWQTPIPSLGAAIGDGLYGIFRTGESLFNNVLWTMRLELIGSCVIYLFYWLPTERFRVQCLACGIVILSLTHNIIYIGFALGALLREVYVAGRLPKTLPTVAVIVGCILGSVGTGFYGRTGLPHIPSSLMPGNRDGIIYPIAAAMIVYGCLASTALQRLLSSAGPRLLGRLSFSLYLYHVPLLYTIFALLYVILAPVSAIGIAAMLLLFTSTSIILSYLGTLFIDEPVLRLNKTIRHFFRSGIQPQLSPRSDALL